MVVETGLKQNSLSANRRQAPTWITSFWRIRGDIPRPLYLTLICLSLVLPLVAWTAAANSGLVDTLFLPKPTDVVIRFWSLLTEGELLGDIRDSVGRVGGGFFLAAFLGVPIGLLIGTFKSMEGLLGPFFALARYMPAAAFIPLVILWLGLDEPAKIAIIFIGTFFYNALMVADSVKFIPKELLSVSYTLGASRWDVLVRVILPYTLPNIIDTLRINIAASWNFVIVAELIAASSGLGYRILKAQRFLRTDEIFVGILVIGLIGLGIDFLFKLLYRLATPWAVDESK